MTDTINRIGYYCGRFGDGLTGEPLNTLSNSAFVIVAGIGFAVWRANPARDRFQLLLIGLAALIGIGSLAFHANPTPTTLLIDLIPIQLFGLAALYFTARRAFGLPIWGAILTIGLFFIARQGWIMIAPRGALGGGITHIPTVLLLLGTALWLALKQQKLGRYFAVAAGFYAAALAARTADLWICERFPLGVHWMWHIFTAGVVGAVLLGLLQRQDKS